MRAVTKPDTTGRARAERLYPAQPCEVCGKLPGGRGTVDRHHIDSDRMNNEPDNIAFLCRKHHNDAHRQSDGRIGGGPRPRVVALMRDRAIARYRLAESYRRDLGWNNRTIAAHLGVHPDSVKRWFAKYEGS